MVGALSVNVPGFGVPRTGGHVRGDNLVSLMASGVIVTVDDATADALSADDVKWLNSFVASGKRAELADMMARRNRVKVEAFARRRKGQSNG
jgi:hypothetical protein